MNINLVQPVDTGTYLTCNKWFEMSIPKLNVSIVHVQTVENNGLTAYGFLLWTVNILGSQQIFNVYPKVSY